jgi:hypothetical protein
MLLEPRLHLAEGLEGLAQLRLIDGVDIVILASVLTHSIASGSYCDERNPIWFVSHPESESHARHNGIHMSVTEH